MFKACVRAGMWYDDAPEKDAPAGSYVARFSWVRFYLALLATVAVFSSDSEAVECPTS
jgi:hypothetical protein